MNNLDPSAILNVSLVVVITPRHGGGVVAYDLSTAEMISQAPESYAPRFADMLRELLPPGALILQEVPQ